MDLPYHFAFARFPTSGYLDRFRFLECLAKYESMDEGFGSGANSGESHYLV
jgi:hypothetical protein